MRLLLRRFPILGGLQLFALLCVAVIGIASANAATLTVTNTNDSGPGSLRQAVAAAQDGDTIQFYSSLNGQTINLTSGQLVINNNITVNGPGPTFLTVARDQQASDFRIFYLPPGHTAGISGLTITGGRLSGDGAGISNGATLTVNNCVISGNSIRSMDSVQHSGGGIHNSGTMTVRNSSVNNNQANFGMGDTQVLNGGGISNTGDLTLDHAMIEMNSGNFNGGGIINNSTGSITITGSTISGNQLHTLFHQFGYGGGICNFDGALTILNSTINNNVYTGDPDGGNGGGVYSSGPLFSIAYSTISGNSAHLTGGGISSDGSLTMDSCTVSGNSVGAYGGGIYGSGTITNSTINNNQSSAFNLAGGGGIAGTFNITNSTLSGNAAISTSGGAFSGGGSITHCTLSDNNASQAGAIYASSHLDISHTILKAGSSGTNIGGSSSVLSHGYNLCSDDGGGVLTAPGDQINTNPMLGPLQDNGGPTFTHALLPGSPAINAGDPNFTPPPFTDQRGPGYARVFNGRIDIGSFEVQPTPPPITISGTISYCSNPVPGPVPNVVLTLTGSASGTMLSDGAGNYIFSSLASGGTYTVTPSKAARTPGSTGIDTVDLVAIQRHFLHIGPPLSGCRLTAADVNGNGSIDTVDVIAIQRFFLGLSTGVANVGKYQFTPVSRTYPGLVSNQTAQNYDTLVFGDVASGFVERPESPSQDAAGDGTSAAEAPATVAAVALPEVAIDQSRSNFIAAVTTSAIDAKSKLVGFQGDFTFDERVVTFQSEPVQKAGLTGGNWNVLGNVLDGPGPIRTLRISAYSNDFTSLSGSGTLFELRMSKVSQPAQGTQLIWAAPPNQFIFIDADLNTQQPGNAAPGSVTTSAGKRK